MIEYITIGALAFFCEAIDSSLGGGYGTILTPVLLLMGYSPLEIVPLILFSEILTGLSAGFMHHKKGNVDLSPRKRAGKTALVLSLCGVAGTILAVSLAVSLPKAMVKAYIAFLLIFLGVFNLLALGRKFTFSWKKVAFLGGLASFNKGMSGGGYGPLVTGGQILTGLDAKSAVGVTSLAEGVTCMVGFALYVFFKGSVAFNWGLGIPLLAGSLLSVPFSVNLVAFCNEILLRKAITVTIILLGVAAFAKEFSHLFIWQNIPLVLFAMALTIPGAYLWGKRSLSAEAEKEMDVETEIKINHAAASTGK